MDIQLSKFGDFLGSVKGLLLSLRIPQLAMLVVFVSILFNAKPTFSGKAPPEIKNGSLDLSGWNFEEDGPINLTGDWQFRWNEMVKPDEVEKAFSNPKPSTIKLPGSWSEYSQVDSLLDDSVGYASYLLKITGINQTEEKLGILQPATGEAYNFYVINGQTLESRLLIKNGVVGITASETIEQQQNRLAYVDFDSLESAYLLLHVSSFHHPKSKVEESPIIGLSSDVISKKTLEDVERFFIAGIIFVMSIYCFSLYSTREEDKASFWLGVFCLTFFMRHLSQFGYFELLFPEASVLSYEFGVKMEYLALSLGAGGMLKFCSNSFPRYFHKKVVNVVWFLSLSLSVLLFSTTAMVYSKILPLFQVLVMFACIFCLIGVVGAFRERVDGSALSLFGFVVMLLAAMNDILHHSFVISTAFIASYAVVVFIFLQTQVVSSVFAKAFKRASILSRYLKREVEDQTREINKKNSELEETTIQARNLLRVVGHDIANPLSIIFANVEMSLYLLEDPKFELEKADIKKRFERIFRASKIQKEILGNVKELISVRDGKKSIDLSPIKVDDIIQQVEFFFSEVVREKGVKLRVESNVSGEEAVLAEAVGLQNNVINNLLTNAIKFSNPGQEVVFGVEEEDGLIVITISDNGIGMPQTLIENLFDFNKDTSRIGTSGEKGTGYGMPIVKTYVDSFRATIEIDSRDIDEYPENHGTTFTLRLRKAVEEKIQSAA